MSYMDIYMIELSLIIVPEWDGVTRESMSPRRFGRNGHMKRTRDYKRNK